MSGDVVVAARRGEDCKGRVFTRLACRRVAAAVELGDDSNATNAFGTTFRTRSPFYGAEGQRWRPTGRPLRKAAWRSCRPPTRTRTHWLRRKRVRVGYIVRVAFDAKHNLIAEQVHSKVTDLALLAETATAAREATLAPGARQPV